MEGKKFNQKFFLFFFFLLSIVFSFFSLPNLKYKSLKSKYPNFFSHTKAFLQNFNVFLRGSVFLEILQGTF